MNLYQTYTKVIQILGVQKRDRKPGTAILVIEEKKIVNRLLHL